MERKSCSTRNICDPLRLILTFLRRHEISLRRKKPRKILYFWQTAMFFLCSMFRDCRSNFLFFCLTLLLQFRVICYYTIVKTTRANGIQLKLTSHKEVSCSGSLTYQANDAKCKRFIMFTAANSESNSLHEEYKRNVLFLFIYLCIQQGIKQ